MIGQTDDLAPADRRLYATRDVTGSVESIPLLVSSILSKKVAEGLDGLVMDVKCGSGAFCDTEEMARDLAQSLVDVANQAGLPTVALITDMDRVLGRDVGNALEVAETVAYLTGNGTREPRLHEVTMALAGEMLALGKLAADAAEGRAKAEAGAGRWPRRPKSSPAWCRRWAAPTTSWSTAPAISAMRPSCGPARPSGPAMSRA